jgi:hypothetical protein
MQEIKKILGQFAFKMVIKDGTLQEVIQIWTRSVAHFSVIKIRMGAADCTNSNFDDRDMGIWTELHSYWNYFFQNTIFSKL